MTVVEGVGRCFNRRMAVTVLVDAENVRRSTWPNLSATELVARCRDWAAHETFSLVVVVDGDAPETADDVEGTGSRSADDRIVELAETIEGHVWVATSDRELRERVGARATRVIGGGTFLRLLEDYDRERG